MLELSTRIKAHEGSTKTSDVHVIAGSKTEQVRRIAFLTGLRLIESGMGVYAYVTNVDATKNDSYPVFLIDEDRVKSELSEEEEFDPSMISGIMKRIRGSCTEKHAIFLSLSEDTYKSNFKEYADASVETDSIGHTAIRKPKYEAEDERDTGRLWLAFVFPAFSFLLIPMTEYFSTVGLSSLFFLYAFLVLGPIVLTGIGILALIIYAGKLRKKNRLILYAGVILFSGEILVPIVLSTVNQLPYNSTFMFSPILGNYTIVSILSTVFQAIALFAFMLIAYSAGGTHQRIASFASLAVGLLYIITVYIEYGRLYYHPTFPGVHLPINAVELLANPYSFPYNTVVFGTAFGQFDAMSWTVTVLSFTSQWLLCAIYVWIAFGLRGKPDPLKEVKKKIQNSRV